MPISETGHAKNVANLNKLVTACTNLGTAYNPSNAVIQIAAMTALLNNAQNALNGLNTAQAALSHSITARNTELKKLSPIITKAVNMLAASGVPAQTISQARTLVRKLSGQRADNTPIIDPVTGKDIRVKISVSQMSIDSRIENFSKFVDFLSGVAQYNPNEADLTINTLRDLHTNIKNTNDAVISSTSQVSNARSNRNTVLYGNQNNVANVALAAKNYVKAVFGIKSTEYKQISSLVFSTI